MPYTMEVHRPSISKHLTHFDLDGPLGSIAIVLDAEALCGDWRQRQCAGGRGYGDGSCVRRGSGCCRGCGALALTELIELATQTVQRVRAPLDRGCWH